MAAVARSAELIGFSDGDQQAPLITIAIPHYKHRRYLELVLESLANQTSRQFEILVSDDCSPDDSNQVIPGALSETGLPFNYYAQKCNLGYDGNVKFCLRSAEAPYVMLLGNDDSLANKNVVTDVLNALCALDSPEVAVTNYCQWDSQSIITRRVTRNGIIGSGPDAALANFRLFSFVSGLIYKRAAAIAHETDRWDDSVYYQIYIASRIIASGGRLAGIDRIAVAKDVEIDGKGVPNYATKYINEPWSVRPHDGGLLSVMRVTIDAVQPFIPAEGRSRAIAEVARQMLMSSYSFWLFEYRRVANWAFAAGLARALRPGRAFSEYSLEAKGRLTLLFTWIACTAIGLLAPLQALAFMKERAAKLLRSRQQGEHG